MTYPHRPGGAAAARNPGQTQQGQWTARRATPGLGAVPPQPATVQRRYEAMALLPDGTIAEVAKRAPSLAVFESAFAALARGTILATEEGPVAIEDLVPGIRVETRDAGFQPLMWIGTTLLSPQAPLAHMPARLFRVPVDSFGPARPMPDLMLAPHARLLHRSPRLTATTGRDEALAPILAFEDGNTVIRVAPVSGVPVYHLAFRDHHILRANGLEIESYHPGDDLLAQLGAEGLRLFLAFFPHLQTVSDFGHPVAPRLSVEEFQDIVAP